MLVLVLVELVLVLVELVIVLVALVLALVLVLGGAVVGGGVPPSTGAQARSADCCAAATAASACCAGSVGPVFAEPERCGVVVAAVPLPAPEEREALEALLVALAALAAAAAARSVASCARAWSSCDWASNTLCCSAVGSIVASSCPALTRSPTRTETAVTVPDTGKAAVTCATRVTVPVSVRVDSMLDRVTLAVVSAAAGPPPAAPFAAYVPPIATSATAAVTTTAGTHRGRCNRTTRAAVTRCRRSPAGHHLARSRRIRHRCKLPGPPR